MRNLCILFALAAAASTCLGSDLRVRNDTQVELKGVVVGDKNYGDIRPGGVTDYQHWIVAYRYSYVFARADSKELRIQPIDYVGERPLGEGKFTYVLTLKSDHLDIRAERDVK